MNTQTAIALQRTMALLVHPSRFVRVHGAVNQDGFPCDPSSPAARRWSLVGGVERFLGTVTPESKRNALSELVFASLALSALGPSHELTEDEVFDHLARMTHATAIETLRKAQKQ